MNGELFFEGKKYISSSRAAKISGYTGDYIGQLCRGGKLECRMVGRSWYVSLDSIVAHKNQNVDFPSNRKKGKSILISNIPDLKSESISILETLEAKEEDASLEFENKRTLEKDEIYIPIRFERDSGPVLPVINRQKFIPRIYGEKDLRNGRNAKGTKTKNKNAQLWGAVKFAQGTYFVAVILISVFFGNFLIKINPQTNAFYHTVATEIKSTFSEVSSKSNNAQERFLASSVKTSFDKVAVSFYSTIRDFIRGARLRILVLLSGKNVAIDQGTNLRSRPSGQGLVVVPQDDSEPRLVTIAKIKDSFSDDVLVKPDEDGTSGVITPVFKTKNGDDFLYVLVPFKK